MTNPSVNGYGDLDLTLSPSTTLYSPSLPFEKHHFPRLEIESLDTSPFSGLFSDMIKDELPIFKSQPIPTVSADASYDIERFTDLHDLQSGWYDEDVEEIIILSPKRSSRNFSPALNYSSKNADVKSPPVTVFDSINALPLVEPTPTTTTRLCRKRDTGRIYVMKTFLGGTSRSPLEYKILETIDGLKAPFLPQIRWSFPGETDLCIITDYYPRKNLEGFISGGGALKPSEALFYAGEVIQAISFLHGAGIIHRDLNPGNVVIDTEGHVILAGYTDADILSCSRNSKRSGRRFSTLRPAVDRKTSSFHAPEVVLGWAHDFSVDCWGFGVLLYYMLSGECLFAEECRSVPQKSLENKIIHDPIILSSLADHHARDLVAKCLERSPIARLTLEDIQRHPYFDSVDWEQVIAKNIPVPHLVDPVFDSNPDLSLQDGRENSSSASSSCGPSASCDTPNRANTKYDPISPSVLTPVTPKRERRNVQSLPKILRMCSLLDDVPEEIEEALDGKTHQGDSSADSSGIYGDSLSSGRKVQQEDKATRQDRMAQFWASLDSEQEAKNSLNKMRSLGGLVMTAKPRKLRKARSTISVYPLRRFSTLSATSLHTKLRKKVRPRTRLQATSDDNQSQNQDVASLYGPPAPPPSPVPPAELPLGIKQMGSGIGFTYNLPMDLAKSKASICTTSNAPLACHGMFQRFQGLGLAGLGLRMGNGLGSARGKAKNPFRGTLRSLGSSVSMSMSGVSASYSSGAPGAASGSAPVDTSACEFGESGWSLMAVPSGTVLVIGDVVGSPGVDKDSPVLAASLSGASEPVGHVGVSSKPESGELEPGVVGCSVCEGVKGCSGNDGEEVLTLRLVPSRPAEPDEGNEGRDK